MGYLYQRKQRNGTLGGIWWAKYYVNGRPIRESTETSKESEAKRFLKEREGRAVTGQLILPRVGRILYEEIATDLRRHYEATGERNLREAETRLKNLDAFFKGRRAVAIDETEVERYVLLRQATGVANGTINRELATLITMLRLASRRKKLLRLPTIQKLKEAAPRQGFFERDHYEAVRRRLRPDLQVAVAIEYTYGWRCQSEVLPLELRQIDLEKGTIRLDAGQTKNADGRVVYLTADLKASIAAQLERVRGLERKLGKIVPYLFPHLKGRHQGERIRDFRKAWYTACQKAGLPGMMRHDFRRTAVRNMVNLGIPERVAMTITGHRTRSVFDRYHIVSPTDLLEAARKLTGTTAGTTPKEIEAVALTRSLQVCDKATPVAHVAV